MSSDRRRVHPLPRRELPPARGAALHGCWRPSSLLALALLSLALLASSATAEPPTVIVLSWDGMRHDYPDRGEFPGLARMEREGARAERLVPVFPASTFPNHVALATGTYTDRHGIVDNVFFDRARDAVFSYDNGAGWIEAEPLWSAAERQGVRAAVYFWVGSESDWGGFGASYRMAPFDGFVDEEEKVRQLVAWLDLPASERPHLLMSWWHGADRAGHRKGPAHADVAAAIAEQDLHLQRLLAALDERDAWGHTTLLLVSDHGMTAVDSKIVIGDVLAEQGIEARALSGGSHVELFFDDPAAVGTAERRLQAVPNVRVLRREAVPEDWRFRHPSRTGDLTLVTEPPYYFSSGSLRSRLEESVQWLFGWKKGGHGYQPTDPDMGAVFLALGRGIAPGTRLPEVRAIDVAPTVAHLLGIEPPASSEGRIVPGIGRVRSAAGTAR